MLLSEREWAMLMEVCDEYGETASGAVRLLLRKEVAAWSRNEPGWRPHQDARWPSGAVSEEEAQALLEAARARKKRR